MAKTFEVLVQNLECAAWNLGNVVGRPDATNSQINQRVKERDDAYDALLKWEYTPLDGEACTTPAPSEVALHEALFQLKDIGDAWRRHWESEPLFYHASWALYRLADQLRDFITGASAPAVEAIPSEQQPQQDLKTLLKDWVKETSTRLGQIDNDGAYSGEPDGDTAARMMWCLQKRFDCLYRRLDGVPSEE